MFLKLSFPNINDPTFRNCVGVLGFVMLEKRNRYDVTFVHSKFIQPLSKKAKGDLIGYLTDNKYIRRIRRFKSKEERMFESYFISIGYKKDPHYFKLLPKILDLHPDYLTDCKVEKVVITNLHHLNFQSFNHWAHNYRHVSINVPSDEIWERVISNSYYASSLSPNRPLSYHISNLKAYASYYGNHQLRIYDVTSVGIENHWSRPGNIFSVCDPVLRNYTSLKNAIEVGIKYNEGVILADQLLKNFGRNDFTDFFIDRATAYQYRVNDVNKKKARIHNAEKALKIKDPDPLNKQLFELPNEEYYKDINQYFIQLEKATIIKQEKENKQERNRNVSLFPTEEELRLQAENELLSQIKSEPILSYEPPEPSEEILKLLRARHKDSDNFYRIEMAKAIFGFHHNAFFYNFFPKTWSDILYHIKAGNKYYFETFVSGINPKVTKKDYRIQIMKDGKFLHPYGPEVYERGQIYYKVVALVWHLRENEIMREIWRKLKTFGILCIPLMDKVLVAGRFEEAVKKITLDTWREHLDSRIKIFPEVIKRY